MILLRGRRSQTEATAPERTRASKRGYSRPALRQTRIRTGRNLPGAGQDSFILAEAASLGELQSERLARLQYVAWDAAVLCCHYVITHSR